MEELNVTFLIKDLLVLLFFINCSFILGFFRFGYLLLLLFSWKISLLVFEVEKLKIFASPSKKFIELLEGLNSFFFSSIIIFSSLSIKIRIL